jgi:6-phosphogluconate dehydrogenase (decarboxylating)
LLVWDKGGVLPMIALSLFTRFRSRVDSEVRGSFAERLLAALRNEFGGHNGNRKS